MPLRYHRYAYLSNEVLVRTLDLDFDFVFSFVLVLVFCLVFEFLFIVVIVVMATPSQLHFVVRVANALKAGELFLADDYGVHVKRQQGFLRQNDLMLPC